MKYLFSAFTKIPCLRLAPDWRARLIRGFEEFPFDSAVPLYIFKNVQALEVSSIDFRQFFGWDRMADQLRSLTLKNASIEDPADILIDIVLDDMDKRRRRTSKVQASPTIPWGEGPRKSPSMSHRELSRSMSAPGSPEPRRTMVELNIGSLTPSEPAVEDGNTSDDSRHTIKGTDTDEGPQSPPNGTRPRSNSPHRPTSSRNHAGHPRTHHRIRRSGSASSNSSLSDSWYYHHSRGSSANLLSTGTLPASKWRFLRHLSLADNSMTSISPNGLAHLSNTLCSLDLSANHFDQIPESLGLLTALRALNLSHCMISSLNSLARSPLPAITALNLRANRLTSLVGVEKLFPLERLDLRDNQIRDPMEIARLTGIPNIREIWVDGNPFTRTHKEYRVTIFTLFRNTPGYTDDIIIDGAGPTYSEKRLLTDRAPIPDAVPVVTLKSVEMHGVHVNKSAAGYYQSREPALLRKDRPVPKAVASESNAASGRSRGIHKRRIVDIANSSVVEEKRDMSPADSETSDSLASDASYRISQQPETELLPPLMLAESRGGALPQKPRSQPAVNVDHSELYDTVGSPGRWPETQDWDNNGEIYRRKIQALRERVGSGYLSVLGEEGWENSNTFDSTNIPQATSFRAAHATTHRLPPIQAIHNS
ncbi:putative leucine-rich repeat-containing protein [Escovopsis weberi]|uniref:Putative leucine-rich repeat-containing protein n=1 Tax=Escovopsis weberi TaxID=150374 RepID=A0A0M9VSR3_ESCWE|nr:putative leucine-rich repeat-containing protein [Escovopsis weberi]